MVWDADVLTKKVALKYWKLSPRTRMLDGMKFNKQSVDIANENLGTKIGASVFIPALESAALIM